jgi:hypothetical protein
MSRLVVKLPDPSTPAATNAKPVYTLPKGVGYHDVTFKVLEGAGLMTVAQMKARIDSIVMKIGGKPVREWTPTTLDIANGTNGARFAMVDGYIVDFFSEPWRRTMEGEERGALGTEGVGDITYEIKFNAAAVAPSIEAHATIETSNRPMRAYPFRHIRNYQVGVINGRTQWPGGGLLREIGLFYDRIHFQSALVSRIKIEVDKNVKWDDLLRADVGVLMARAGLVLQANVYTVAFSASSQQLFDQLSSFLALGDNSLAIVNDLRVEIVGTGAGTADVFTEQYQIFK